MVSGRSFVSHSCRHRMSGAWRSASPASSVAARCLRRLYEMTFMANPSLEARTGAGVLRRHAEPILSLPSATGGSRRAPPHGSRSPGGSDPAPGKSPRRPRYTSGHPGGEDAASHLLTEDRVTDSADRTTAPARRLARPAAPRLRAALALIAFSTDPGRPAGRRHLLQAGGVVAGQLRRAGIRVNIALFVPLGVLVALQLPRWRWAAVIAEPCPWRRAAAGGAAPRALRDPSDVVANTIGTALGVLLVALVRRRGSR